MTRWTKVSAWAGGFVTAVLAGAIVERTTTVCVTCVIGSGARLAWGAWTHHFSIPTWGVLALIVIPMAGYVLVRRFLEIGATLVVPWLGYTTDNFDGVRWQWTYLEGKPTGVIAFCPNCDFQLGVSRTSRWDPQDLDTLICEHCGFKRDRTTLNHGCPRLNG
jgi:predicted RNA-binding Zn-ribbon protein involved in translation (DUF1610 family)